MGSISEGEKNTFSFPSWVTKMMTVPPNKAENTGVRIHFVWFCVCDILCSVLCVVYWVHQVEIEGNMAG